MPTSTGRWTASSAPATAGSCPPDFALQVPDDYRQVLSHAVPQAVEASGVAPSSIVGIGVDFTSATVIFADDDGTPMCELEQFRNEPHAYAKLWKHHGAQEQAHRIVALAKERGETWLARYGGDLSSELLMPKALETLEKAPDVYRQASQIVDAVDWITWQLTGTLTLRRRRLGLQADVPGRALSVAGVPRWSQSGLRQRLHREDERPRAAPGRPRGWVERDRGRLDRAPRGHRRGERQHRRPRPRRERERRPARPADRNPRHVLLLDRVVAGVPRRAGNLRGCGRRHRRREPGGTRADSRPWATCSTGSPPTASPSSTRMRPQPPAYTSMTTCCP